MLQYNRAPASSALPYSRAATTSSVVEPSSVMLLKNVVPHQLFTVGF